MTDVTLQYFDGCPNWQTTDRHLRTLRDELGIVLHRQLVSTPEEAERVGFRGSPTVLVDGRDPFAEGDEPAGLACRTYVTEDGVQGSPTLAQLRAVLQ